jgi:hypothetical protein
VDQQLKVVVLAVTLVLLVPMEQRILVVAVVVQVHQDQLQQETVDQE